MKRSKQIETKIIIRRDWVTLLCNQKVTRLWVSFFLLLFLSCHVVWVWNWHINAIFWMKRENKTKISAFFIQLSSKVNEYKANKVEHKLLVSGQSVCKDKDHSHYYRCCRVIWKSVAFPLVFIVYMSVTVA